MSQHGWVSILCIALVGCQTPRIKFYDDRAAMQRELTALVPPGTRITDAKETMRANDFGCVERQIPQKPDPEEPLKMSGYLDCDHSQMAGIFGNYHLTVQFPCTDDGRVGEVCITKLEASRGLAKQPPPSDIPQTIGPAPLWTKVVLGTGLTVLVVVMAPLALYGMAHGG